MQIRLPGLSLTVGMSLAHTCSTRSPPRGSQEELGGWGTGGAGNTSAAAQGVTGFVQTAMGRVPAGPGGTAKASPTSEFPRAT